MALSLPLNWRTFNKLMTKRTMAAPRRMICTTASALIQHSQHGTRPASLHHPSTATSPGSAVNGEVICNRHQVMQRVLYQPRSFLCMSSGRFDSDDGHGRRWYVHTDRGANANGPTLWGTDAMAGRLAAEQIATMAILASWRDNQVY